MEAVTQREVLYALKVVAADGNDSVLKSFAGQHRNAMQGVTKLLQEEAKRRAAIELAENDKVCKQIESRYEALQKKLSSTPRQFVGANGPDANEFTGTFRKIETVEQQYLVRRQVTWTRTESQIQRLAEQTARAQEQANGRLARSLVNTAGATAGLVRGLGMMGLVGEKNTGKLVDGLLRLQGSFDVIVAGVRIFGGLSKAAEHYATAIGKTTAAQRAESLAATLAQEKSLALTGALSSEAAAATAAANAHARLGAARGGGSRIGGRVPQADDDYTLAPLRGQSKPKQHHDYVGYVGDTIPYGMQMQSGDWNMMPSRTTRGEQREVFDAMQSSKGRRGGGGGFVAQTAGDVATSIVANEAAAKVTEGTGSSWLGMAAGIGTGGVVGSAAGYAGRNAMGAIGRNLSRVGLFTRGAGLATRGVRLATNPYALAVAGTTAAGVSGFSSLRQANRYGFGQGAEQGTIASGIANTEVGFADLVSFGRASSTADQRALALKTGRTAFDARADETQTAERTKTLHQQSVEIRARREARFQDREEAYRPIRDRLERQRDLRRETDIQTSVNRDTDRFQKIDLSADVRLARLTESLEQLTKMGQGGGFRAQSVLSSMAAVNAESRQDQLGRLSAGVRLDRSMNEAATAGAENDKERITKRLTALRASPRTTDAQLKTNEAQLLAAEEKLRTLSKERHQIERQISEERRKSSEAALDGIKREIAARREASQQIIDRVNSAKENFTELEPDQQQRMLTVGRQLQADRDKLLSTGRTTQEEQADQATFSGFRQTQSQLATARANLTKVGSKEQRESRREQAATRASGLREKLGSLVGELGELRGQRGGFVTEKRKALAAEIKETRDELNDSNKASRGTDRQDRQADELNQRKAIGFQISRLSEQEQRQFGKIQATTQTRMQSFVTAQADRAFMSDYEHRRAAGRTTAEDDERADRINTGLTDRVAKGLPKSDRRLLAQDDTAQSQAYVQSSRRQEADSLGYGAAYGLQSRSSQENGQLVDNGRIEQKIVAELKDNRELKATVIRDDNETARLVANSLKPQLDALDRKLVSMVENELSKRDKIQQAQMGNQNVQRALGAKH